MSCSGLNIYSPNCCDVQLYASPVNAAAVLIVDGRRNTLDTTTLRVPSGSWQWYSIVLCPLTNKLYAPPADTNVMLIVDPDTNTVDTTLLQIPYSHRGWTGIAYSNISKTM